MKTSSAQPDQHGIKPYKSESQNSPVHASVSAASAPTVAAANSSTKQNEPNLTPINPEKPSTNHHHTSKSSSAKEVAKIILLGFGAVLCCPCLPIYMYVCVRRSRKTNSVDSQRLSHYSRPDAPSQSHVSEMRPPAMEAAQPARYSYGPAYNAYQNLDTYGPEGVFELSDRPELPPPAPLGSSYLVEVDRGRY